MPSINDPGWEGLEAQPPKTAEIQPIDKIYARVFSSADGQTVLKHLKTVTTERETWVPGADPSYGYFREGQNMMTRYIIDKIKRGADG